MNNSPKREMIITIQRKQAKNLKCSVEHEIYSKCETNQYSRGKKIITTPINAHNRKFWVQIMLTTTRMNMKKRIAEQSVQHTICILADLCDALAFSFHIWCMCVCSFFFVCFIASRKHSSSREYKMRRFVDAHTKRSD